MEQDNSMETNGAGPSMSEINGNKRVTKEVINMNKTEENGNTVDGNGNMPDTIMGEVPRATTDKFNEEIIRLIIQFLKFVGLEQSADMLMKESGYHDDHPAATMLKKHIMQGHWLKADSNLNEIVKVQKELVGCDSTFQSNLNEVKFMLREQRYLELLEDERILDALHILQNELTPIQRDSDRVHKLASHLMCLTPADLYEKASWPGKNSTDPRKSILEHLHKYFPANIMLPPQRLQTLFLQAIERQVTRCHYHNISIERTRETTSLFMDHACPSSSFPMHHLQTIDDHYDEVWFVAFSPDGTQLATGSKDKTVIIWNVDPIHCQLSRKKTLKENPFGIAFMSWSPDSKYLIAIGPENNPEVLLWNMETDQPKVIELSPTDSLSTAAWHADSTRFIAGGRRGQFYQCDVGGYVTEFWEGIRVNALACRSDGKTVFAADTLNRICSYYYDNIGITDTIVQEQHPIMSFTVDSTEKYALLNLAWQGVHLWDLKNKSLLKKFVGLSQGRYTIHSCFGGIDSQFIASGSEDSIVYVWHVNGEMPIAKLTGHADTVSCVSWNPIYHHMLVSASDDGTVRLWGPKRP